MTKRRLLVVGIVMLMVVGMVLVGIRSCGHFALQRYVAELRARGEPMSVAELTASYSPSPPGWISEFTNRLAALGPSPADGGRLRLADFTPPNLALVTWKMPQPPWTSEDGKQTNLSWLEISGRLSTARPVMRQLQKLLERPLPNSGPSTNWLDWETFWREKRSAAGWLACDTLVNLREGRQADALTSLWAIAGLARMHREDCTLAHQLCCVAVANVGLDLVWEALQAEGWSEEQLSAIQRCWEELDLIAAVAMGLQGERLLPLLALSMASERHRSVGGAAPVSSGGTRPTSPSNQGYSFFYRKVLLPNDVLYGLRHIQRQVELVRELRDGRSYREVWAAVAQQKAVLDAKAESATRFLYPLTLIAIPAYEPAVMNGAKAEAKRRLAITAVALHRYHLKYGHWPRELAGLSPEFLRKVPRDCMNGQPLKYRVNKDGTFTLYSVGIDGIDQGGDPTPEKPGFTGLGDGLDAVWRGSGEGIRRSAE